MRTIFESSHQELRARTRDFLERECVPQRDEWARQGYVDREAWMRAGQLGLLGLDVPQDFGGAGVRDWRYNAVVAEEVARSSTGMALSLQNDVIAPFLSELASPEQKSRWLPGLVSGELLVSLAVAEPGAGSDLSRIRTSAERVWGGYRLNGSKTFVAGGRLADLVLVLCRTDATAGLAGFSILAVENGTRGLTKGRRLDKIGNPADDAVELTFVDAVVPTENLVGEEGHGYHYVMHNLARERLGIAVGSVAAAEKALELTLEHTRRRKPFEQNGSAPDPITFALVEMHTKLTVTRTYLDQCIVAAAEGRLAPEDAAAAKWWCTEVQWEVVDRCLQLFGGHGFVGDDEISRLWNDARAQRLAAGTTEALKTVVGRALDL